MSEALRKVLAEVDQLEVELRELGREVETEQGLVRHLGEIHKRDNGYLASAESELRTLNQEIGQLEEQEKCLRTSVDSSSQSNQLLTQMESQARGRLGEERRETKDLHRQLACNVSLFKEKVEQREEQLKKIPEYCQMLKMENVLIRMKVALDEVKGRCAPHSGEGTNRWTVFKKTCVELAKQWFITNGHLEILVCIEREKVQAQADLAQTLSDNEKSMANTGSGEMEDTNAGVEVEPESEEMQPLFDENHSLLITSDRQDEMKRTSDPAQKVRKDDIKKVKETEETKTVPGPTRHGLIEVQKQILINQEHPRLISKGTKLPGKLDLPQLLSLPVSKNYSSQQKETANSSLNLKAPLQLDLPTFARPNKIIGSCQKSRIVQPTPTSIVCSASQQSTSDSATSVLGGSSQQPQYVPPTPNTKQRLLKLGDSLMKKKESPTNDIKVNSGNKLMENEIEMADTTDALENIRDTDPILPKLSLGLDAPSSISVASLSIDSLPRRMSHTTMSDANNKPAPADKPSVQPTAPLTFTPCKTPEWTPPPTRKPPPSDPIPMDISPGTALSEQKRNLVLQQLLHSPAPPPKRTPPTIRKQPYLNQLSISPGTALSDEKRDLVLQQLLESPVPVPRVTRGKETVTKVTSVEDNIAGSKSGVLGSQTPSHSSIHAVPSATSVDTSPAAGGDLASGEGQKNNNQIWKNPLVRKSENSNASLIKKPEYKPPPSNMFDFERKAVSCPDGEFSFFGDIFNEEEEDNGNSGNVGFSFDFGTGSLGSNTDKSNNSGAGGDGAFF